MMEIVIYSGDTPTNKELNEIVSEFFVSFNLAHRISTYINTEELFASIEKGYRFHIIFIDIDPQCSDSIVLSESIRKYDKKCVIILVACSADFAVKGYAVHAFDYLIKPINRKKIKRTLLDAINSSGSRLFSSLRVRAKGIDVFVKCSNIVFIESARHYIKIHMNNGNEYEVYGKLNEYEDMLSGYKSYLRCHQSFLVNMDYVKNVKGRDFVMADNSKIPIRKSSFAKIKKEYYKYIMEHPVNQ
jgi:DNA-binding LytR/AlgR family response regulator